MLESLLDYETGKGYGIGKKSVYQSRSISGCFGKDYPPLPVYPEHDCPQGLTQDEVKTRLRNLVNT